MTDFDPAEPTDEECEERRAWFDRWKAVVDAIDEMPADELPREMRNAMLIVQHDLDKYADVDDPYWYSYEWDLNRWIWYALAVEDAVVKRATALNLDLNDSELKDEFALLHNTNEEAKEFFFGFTRGLNRPTAGNLEMVAQGRFVIERPQGRVFTWMGTPQPFEPGEDPDADDYEG